MAKAGRVRLGKMGKNLRSGQSKGERRPERRATSIPSNPGSGKKEKKEIAPQDGAAPE